MHVPETKIFSYEIAVLLGKYGVLGQSPFKRVQAKALEWPRGGESGSLGIFTM